MVFQDGVCLGSALLMYMLDQCVTVHTVCNVIPLPGCNHGNNDMCLCPYFPRVTLWRVVVVVAATHCWTWLAVVQLPTPGALPCRQRLATPGPHPQCLLSNLLRPTHGAHLLGYHQWQLSRLQ